MKSYFKFILKIINVSNIIFALRNVERTRMFLWFLKTFHYTIFTFGNTLPWLLKHYYFCIDWKNYTYLTYHKEQKMSNYERKGAESYFSKGHFEFIVTLLSVIWIQRKWNFWNQYYTFYIEQKLHDESTETNALYCFEVECVWIIQIISDQ